MFAVPKGLRAQLEDAGWSRLHDSLFACNVDLGPPQPERGVWLTRRTADSMEALRPIALDDHDAFPALRREGAAPVDDMYSINGMLVLVHSLRFPPDIRDINGSALVLASRTPGAPRELNLTIESGWSPFACKATWELRRWWTDEGHSDW